MLGLLIALVLVVLIAVWLAPMVPHPGGRLLAVVCWIAAVIIAIYLIAGLLTGATAGVGLGD